MQSQLREALQAFRDPNSETQLRVLDEAVRAVEPGICVDADVVALLDVIERFPEHDGFGVFWSILHTLEACPGYEQHLVASVRRKPCRFSLLMLERLQSTGIEAVDGQRLGDLLRSIEPQHEHAASTAAARASDA